MSSKHKMLPQGVVVDRQGRILVADSYNSCIKLFSHQGEFLKDLVTREDGLTSACALTINSQQHLVVTDLDTQDIKIFSYLE